MSMALLNLIHVLAVVVWIGGMFFAYMILRPGMAGLLKQEERLTLWDKVFARFFKWVWLAVAMLFTTGSSIIYHTGGMKNAAPHIHVMLLSGTAMSLIFVYVYFYCYARFNPLVAAKDWPAADKILVTIRKLIAINLTLGILTICVAIIGRAM
jgi:uncharacterized membrane protein